MICRLLLMTAQGAMSVAEDTFGIDPTEHLVLVAGSCREGAPPNICRSMLADAEK